MALGNRIRYYREKAGLTLDQLSERSGVDVGTISALENRNSSRSKFATPIAKGLGMTVEMLEDEHQDLDVVALMASPIASTLSTIGVPVSKSDAPPEGYVRLQHLSPKPSMGHGAALAEPVHVVQHLDVLESWVLQKVGSTDYSRIKILTGCGQSMQPTIQDQDLVFVDTAQRFIDMPGIYVLDVCGRLLLKRALILSTGTLVLKSDNSTEFPDEEHIDLKTAGESVNVAGRVKGWWTLKQG
ncbi:XRE family transcriptional regulator [Comamonas aquatica]|uniref:XRE family transcriptional regulator n=1 Tax=Comamonas aquatica TaxID=225991 RepID=UPI0031E36C89